MESKKNARPDAKKTYTRERAVTEKRRELEAAKVDAMKESEKAKTFLEEKVKEMEVAERAAEKDTKAEKEVFEKREASRSEPNRNLRHFESARDSSF